jgi:hypothetical protein
VVVAAGTYPDEVWFQKSGTASAPTTFRAAPGAVVTVHSFQIAASHIRVQGFAFDGTGGSSSSDCVSIWYGITDVAVRDSTITGCGRDGIRFVRPGTNTYATDVTIERNRVWRTGRANANGNGMTVTGDRITVTGNDISAVPNDAIDMWGDRHTYRGNFIHDLTPASSAQHDDAWQTWIASDGMSGRPVTNLVIEDNRVERINGPDAHCIMASGYGHTTWTVQRNLFRSVGDQCVIVGEVKSLTIDHNTLVAAGAHNTIELNLATTGRVSNNIFHDAVGWGGGAPISIASSASVSHDYNLASGSTKSLAEAHGRTGDAKFADVGAGDFRLLPGSLALGGGEGGTDIGAFGIVG